MNLLEKHETDVVGVPSPTLTPEEAKKLASQLSVIDGLAAGPGLRVLSKKPTIEIAPGVTVSKHLIDEVAKPNEFDKASAKKAAAFGDHSREMREDIDASRDFLQFLVRTREELQDLKPDERFVSFDRMSPELQRVCTAFAASEAAKAELREAVDALRLTMSPA